MTTDDLDLVRQYALGKSEEAFASLVSRHVNLVYSVALRQVRDAHLAEEVTQSVFLILARKAGSLSSQTVISGWLCRTARHASVKALTLQRRRQHREQEACMQSQLSEPESEAWRQIEPLLEAAMAQLAERDHDAVVLRFFEGRNFKDVSTALGTSEAGAKMRVYRALEKLRAFFVKRGVSLSAALIGGAVSAHSVHAAPTGLVNGITDAAVKGSAVAVSTLTLTEGTLKLMAWTKFKAAVAAGAIVLVAVGTLTVTRHRAKEEPQPAPLTFAGYATPEASMQSLIWAASVGDFEKFEAASTPDQQERFRRNLAGKSDEEKKRKAAAWANTLATYKITHKDILSEDEVHLHISSPLSPDGRRGGNEIVIMRKVGDVWKQAGRQ